MQKNAEFTLDISILSSYLNSIIISIVLYMGNNSINSKGSITSSYLITAQPMCLLMYDSPALQCTMCECELYLLRRVIPCYFDEKWPTLALGSSMLSLIGMGTLSSSLVNSIFSSCKIAQHSMQNIKINQSMDHRMHMEIR